MPEQQTDPPDDIRMPRKRQARLDDNGEPAGVPVSKKVKLAGKNGQKNKAPAKTRPQNKKTGPKITSATTSAVAPAKKKTSAVTAEIEPELANNSDDTRGKNDGTNPQEAVVVGSSDDEIMEDDVEIVEKHLEEEEEDDEAELGVYLLSNKIVNC
jgi:hypothetical protein